VDGTWQVDLPDEVNLLDEAAATPGRS
jgi:hypothetical protein